MKIEDISLGGVVGSRKSENLTDNDKGSKLDFRWLGEGIWYWKHKIIVICIMYNWIIIIAGSVNLQLLLPLKNIKKKVPNTEVQISLLNTNSCSFSTPCKI